jgi:hypothetical protein
VSQVRLDVLHRSHALRLRGHRAAHHLEVQLRKTQILRKRVENTVAIVPRIQESASCVWKDEGVPSNEPFLRRFRTLLFPEAKLLRQTGRQMDVRETPIGLSKRPDLSLVDGFGDRQRVNIIEGSPAQRE